MSAVGAINVFSAIGKRRGFLEISIIIPVYNAEAYLRLCLDSVLNQTLHDMEVLCVNDGSSDRSGEVLTEYAAKDSRIKVFSQVNSGQGAARNKGLDIAKGEYIYFMDADDELANRDALIRLVNEMARENLDVLFFDAETVVDEGIDNAAVRAEDYIRKNDYSAVRSGRELFSEFLKNREYTVSPCLAIYRRAFLEKNNIHFPSERIFYEDNIFMTRVLLAAKRVSHRPWQLYIRKVHAGSTVTSNPTMRHLRGYLACYKDTCGLLAKKEWNCKTRRALRDRWTVYKLNVRRMCDSYPNLLESAKRELDEGEWALLLSVLEYPIGEKIVNGFRCLQEHGVVYTIKRILFGRQKI